MIGRIAVVSVESAWVGATTAAIAAARRADAHRHDARLRGKLPEPDRSKLCPQLVPIGADSKRFHNFFAVKFGAFGAAARHAAQLKGNCTDPAGRAVEIIRKGAKAGRPPHTVMRGEMLHPFGAKFERCLKPGEELQPHHTARCDTKTIFFAYLDDQKPVAQPLGVVKWTDGGEANVPTAVTELHKSIDSGARRQLKALIA